MKTVHKVGGAAGVIACCLAFTPIWEGTDLVAKVDTIGTGHPLTYCNGLTSTDGAVKAGQRFTPAQCKKLLAEALPKYWSKIEPCIHVPLPDKTASALLDAGFNAGSSAVCHSQMLKKMNAGDLFGGCDAFVNFAITVQHGRIIVPGLINRRGGNPKETRKTEKALCLEGIDEQNKKIKVSKIKVSFWTRLIAFLKGL